MTKAPASGGIFDPTLRAREVAFDRCHDVGAVRHWIDSAKEIRRAPHPLQSQTDRRGTGVHAGLGHDGGVDTGSGQCGLQAPSRLRKTARIAGGTEVQNDRRPHSNPLGRNR
mmetsp:Transcript_4215/g.7621  ORF Transcript_4215/g.7621 Transcript_4215/m.7621 type:complete len:112 (-) Transcript_4215:55-390(-)